MNRRIKILLLSVVVPMAGFSQPSYETKFTKSFSETMETIEKQFGVRFKYNVDTAGLKVSYADFRVRPYSIEETLKNILTLFDFNYWKQNGNVYKIKPYEYPRRHDEEGKQMLDWLSLKYTNLDQWQPRRDSLRHEVRRLLGVDEFLNRVKGGKVTLSKVRNYDGYTVQNIAIETVPGQHVYGSIYSSKKKGKHPLIICPGGHFYEGRYRKDQQQRLGTLARMGAVCVDFDLYGWGQSEAEVGAEAHHTSLAHTVQAASGILLLDYMLSHRKDIDTQRIGVNGGSGGGTHTVLLSTIDDRFTASCPVVSLASHFDGGCPCESGMPVQLACGGTCNPELAATFAPLPMMIVSDGGDWTHTVPYMELPFLQRVYGFYGAEGKVKNVHLPSERHDFGPNKRQAVYDFFIETFGLDRSMLDENKVSIVPADVLKSQVK